jgi:hypothetical protein
MKVAIGIDLTQHIPLVCSIKCDTDDCDKIAAAFPQKPKFNNKLMRSLPCALLPLFKGENLMSGEAAALHRRSSGYPWPPESKVPYTDPGTIGNEHGGVARVPLLAAWHSLLPEHGAAGWLAGRDEEVFKWFPGQNCSEKAGAILAKSVRAYIEDSGLLIKDSVISIVVPDALDEFGQQSLIDNLERQGFNKDLTLLVPRPVAIAVDWCGKQPEEDIEAEDGEALGRLRVLSTPMDTWEATSMEIRAKKMMGRTWLIPIRDRSGITAAARPPELSTFGMRYALAMAAAGTQPSKEGLAKFWKDVFASEWFDGELKKGTSIAKHHGLINENTEQQLMEECLGESFWDRVLESGIESPEEINSLWNLQETELDNEHMEELAVVRDGSLSKTDCVKNIPGKTLSGSGYHSAASGAAYTSLAIAAGLPTYEETLLPLQLFVRARDKWGDLKGVWKDLVIANSVAVGRTWENKKPIEGLVIPEGYTDLTLPLQREEKGTPIFRNVKALLKNKVEKNEPVIITTRVRPGQGLAIVEVKSKTPSLFSTRLDWVTMKECEEPKPLPLAWIPGVQEVRPLKRFYSEAEFEIRRAQRSLDSGRYIDERLQELTEKLNNWIACAKIDDVPTNDPNVFYGVLPSEGGLSRLRDCEEITKLRDSIGETFSSQLKTNGRMHTLVQRLIRVSGWFYTAIPEEVLKYLQERVRVSYETGSPLENAELGSVGLAVQDDVTLWNFFTIAERVLSDTNHPPNEWARAIRNICRFRNSALKEIESGTLKSLTNNLFRIMGEQVYARNYKHKFRNCLIAIAFLLKRRRYDQDFLPSTSELVVEMLDVLGTVHRQRNQLPDKIRHLPKLTMKLLEKTASQGELEELLDMVN